MKIYNFVAFVLCFAVGSAVEPQLDNVGKFCINALPNPDLKSVNFTIVKEKNVNYGFTIDELCRLIKEQNCTGSIIFYAHGYNEKLTDESVRTVRESFEKTRPNACYVQIDYSAYVEKTNDSYTINGYGPAVVNGVATGKRLGEILCKANCTNITKIEFIGHSLGAQVVAAAAKVLIDCGKKPPMITGLDPAGPGFYFLGPIFVCGLNLNADLADQVVIFHTDRGRFGIFIREGSLDFDVNCGIQYQPGCKVDTKPSQPPIGSVCSHQHSWKVYAAFISGTIKLYAISDPPQSGCRELSINDLSTLKGKFTVRTAVDNNNQVISYGDGACNLPSLLECLLVSWPKY